MRRLIPQLLLIIMTSLVAEVGAKEGGGRGKKMREYAFEVDHVSVAFSLAEPWSNGMYPIWRTGRFVHSSGRPPLGGGGFKRIFDQSWELKAPFWIGAYGMLRFQGKIYDTISGRVSSAPDLKAWLIEDLDEVLKTASITFEIESINDVEWVHWRRADLAEISEQNADRIYENYSLPIGDGQYINLQFNVVLYEGRALTDKDRWLPGVVTMKEHVAKSLRVNFADRASKSAR